MAQAKRKPTPHEEALAAVANRRLDETDVSGKSLREKLTDDGSLHDPKASADFDPDQKDSDTRGLAIKRVTAGEDQIQVTPGEDPITEKVEIPPEPIDKTGDDRDVSAPYQKKGKWYVSMKVDGEQVELTVEQLRRSAQKDAASEARFRAVGEKEVSVSAREQRLALQVEQHAAKVASDLMSTNAPIDVDRAYDDIVLKEEAEAKRIIQEIAGGRRPPQEGDPVGRDPQVSTPDIESLVRDTVGVALSERDARSLEAETIAAREQWKIDYSDVWGDDHYRSIANKRTIDLQQAALDEGRDIVPTEILAEAGEFARTWRQIETGETPAEAGIQSRAERKRQMPAPVTSSGARAPASVQEDRPPTRSEVVAQMQKSRGQSPV